MSYDEMIAVITAIRDGKPVDKQIIGTDRWCRCDDPVPNFTTHKYRLASEPRTPRECWGIERGGKLMEYSFFPEMETVERVISALTYPTYKLVHFREVM